MRISHATRREARHTRAKKFADLYQAGYTLRQIGDFQTPKITRERVRQLLAEIGVTKTDGGYAAVVAQKRAARRQIKDAKCLNRFGCTYEQYQTLLKICRDMHASGTSRQRTPCGAFVMQKGNAKKRGIKWRMKLWEWWQLWQASGKWDKRGVGQGYVMARHNDAGAYEVGNVSIITAAKNTSDGNKKNKNLPIGVQKNPSGTFTAFRCFEGHNYRIGTFPTAELAHAAYVVFRPEHREAA